MLLPDDIHPNMSIYYNGAQVLHALQRKGAQDLLELFLDTQEFKKMSMPVFVLCLDWLYLIELIKMDEQGSISLCS